MKKVFLTGTIPTTSSGQRIDQALASLFPEYSRARLTLWLKQKHITVDHKLLLPKEKIKGGEEVVIDAALEEERWEAESIALDIIYEDTALIVVNKPAGLVVHPAQGHFEHTLVNALLHHCPSLGQLPRAGLIHRLDKDTTGLLVVAKTLPAHTALVKAMQQREIQRQYQTIVYGNISPSGVIRTGMARHPHQRLKMAVSKRVGSKEAVTHYTCLGYYAPFSYLSVKLETGRTHQIRVHLSHIKFPIVGDPLYGIPGKQMAKYKQVPEMVSHFLETFARQALHAYSLGLIHPITQEYKQWQVPLPEDMQKLLSLIQNV